MSGDTGIGWGCIGASNFANTYVVPAIQADPHGTAIAVFSTSLARGRRFAHEHGLERAYPSLDLLLADPAIDAVYVSTTNDLHAEQTIASARAGKHVLCEKPLALTLADAIRMRQACEDAGVVMGVNHHIRGAPAIEAMRRLVADGAIGDVLAARVFNAWPLPESLRTWRIKNRDLGAGAVLDMTVHDADTLRYLLDDDVAEVSAMTASQGLGEEGIEDSVVGVMRFGRGAVASFHDSYTISDGDSGIELHGTAGSLIGQNVLTPDPIGDVLLKRQGEVRSVDIPQLWPLYENVVRRFSEAVEGNGRPLTTADDGVASLAIALAVLESARNATRVAVPDTRR